VKIEMTPRVTYEGEIVLDLYVENSTIGVDREVGGVTVPSFPTRNVRTRLRLREGEATLLAGLLQDEERRSLTGFPGLVNLPIIRYLFSANNDRITQTDIVMLITPRIVRTHELTAQDLAPIYIGTQTNLGLSGPPPLIAGPDAPAEPGAAPADAAPALPPLPGAAPTPPPPVGGPGANVAPPPTPSASQAQSASVAPPAGGVPVVPPGSTAVPGTTAVPAAAVASPGAGGGQIIVSPPTADFQVKGGPYTVPISITGASQISSVSLTVTYNPAVLRVRAATEGSFMRTGGVAATFTQQNDSAAGRIDIAIMRSGDTTGVAGTGLLAALLFDAVGPGAANLSVTATATGPSGTPVTLQFAPIPAVSVR
jgi:general secretion pathway protein D